MHSLEVWKHPPSEPLPYNFLLPTYMDMKRQILKEKADDKKQTCICLFMSMLFSKIKFEIDINNDELLRTMSERAYKDRRKK